MPRVNHPKKKCTATIKAMPTYVFEHKTTGQLIELVLPIADRDKAPKGYKRITVPFKVGYANASHLREPGVDVAVPKAFREIEQGGTSAREIARQTGFSVDHIRRVFNFLLLFLFSVSLPAVAADISAGYVFSSGEANITHTKLNSVVGGASITTDFLTGKTLAQPTVSDLLLFYSASAQDYRKANFNTLLLGNTNLILGQVEQAVPLTNDFVLLYSATDNLLRKTTVDSLIRTNALLLASQPEDTNAPIDNTQFLTSSNGVYARRGLTNLFSEWWRWEPLAISNSPLLSLHTAPTNSDLLRIWDSVNGTNKATTIAGLITNMPNATALTNADAFLFISTATNANNLHGTNPIVSQVALSNIAHYAVQQFTVSGIAVPSANVVVTNSHGLPGTPQIIDAALVCVTNNIGYVSNDVVMISAVSDIGGTRPLTLSADGTNIYMAYGGSSGSWAFNRKNTGAGASITNNCWTIRIRAFYYP